MTNQTERQKIIRKRLGIWKKYFPFNLWSDLTKDPQSSHIKSANLSSCSDSLDDMHLADILNEAESGNKINE